jgi:hypothetical protein
MIEEVWQRITVGLAQGDHDLAREPFPPCPAAEARRTATAGPPRRSLGVTDARDMSFVVP